MQQEDPLPNPNDSPPYSQEEEASQEEGELSHQSANSFGFRPMEPSPEEIASMRGESLKRQKPEETAKMKELKAEINKLLCRYPGLVPRTSSAIMQRLSEMSEEELENIHINMLNDITEVRGTPSAEAVIMALTYWADAHHIPGYTSVCLSDIELKRDIESEIIKLIGFLNTKLNILFRFLNNAYTCMRLKRFAHRDPMEELFVRKTEDSEDAKKTTAPIQEVTVGPENPFERAFREGRAKASANDKQVG
jgi:hypothetical protein